MLRPTAQDCATRPIQRRNPVAARHYPLSRPVYAPAEIVPFTETASQWSPYFFAVGQPYFGGHDPLSETDHGVMHVAQADLYDASPNPWPNNGQFDRPNGLFSLFPGLLRLRRESSAHPGYMNPTHPGPNMLFVAPPVFSTQTQPIPATGI